MEEAKTIMHAARMHLSHAVALTNLDPSVKDTLRSDQKLVGLSLTVKT